MSTAHFSPSGIADIDECALGISGCEQVCHNYDGGYSCECYSGYVLDTDQHNCSGTNTYYVHILHAYVLWSMVVLHM